MAAQTGLIRRARRAAADPAVLLALVLALSGLARAWDLGRRSAGLDFYQFWVVAQVAGRDDVPNVYADEARARIGAEFLQRSLMDEDSERRRVAARPWSVLEPTATPLLYTAFRPLAGASYETDDLLFRVLSLLCCAAGTLAIARLVGLPPAACLLAVAFIAHSFQPLKADIRVGNVNQVQLGLVALYLWLSARDDGARAQVAAGALLALLVLFKPNLLPVVPALVMGWLAARRWRKVARQAAGLAGGAVAGLLLPVLTFGTASAWRDWFAYLSALPPAKIPLRFGNMGLARLLLETAGVDLALPLAAFALVAVLVCQWRGRRWADDEPARPAAWDDTAAVAAGALVYLLSSPMVWLHYLLLALPAVLVLVVVRDGTRFAWPAALAVAALAGMAVDPAADAFAVQRLEAQAAITSASLLLLLVLVCRQLARRWAPLPAPGEGTTIATGGAP